jgi:DNA polymerase delta subunit 4
VTKSVPRSAKESAAASPLRKELLRDKISSDLEDVKAEEPTPEPTPEPVGQIRKKTEESNAKKSDVELKAESLSDAAITRYWRKLESERMSNRVHQEDLTTGEKILRYFDVSSQYGVSVHFLLAEMVCKRHNGLMQCLAMHWNAAHQAVAESAAVGSQSSR